MNRPPIPAPPREPSMGVARNLNFNTPATLRRLAKKEHVEVQQQKQKEQPSTQPSTHRPIQVFLRIRPFNANEKAKNAETCILKSKDPNILLIEPKELTKHPPTIRNAGHAKFKFSHILSQDSTQEQVFEKTTLPLIDGLFHGLSAVVFAYGVTCSGKTWTIQGVPEDPGILPRTLDVIINSIAMAKGMGLAQDSNVSDSVAELTEGALCFTRRRPRARVGDRKLSTHDANYVNVKPDVEYKIFASYLEIYNETCYDLFDNSSSVSAVESASDVTIVAEVKDEPFVLAETETSRTFIANPDVITDVIPRRRRVLKLKDAHGHVYADGLTEVEIKSAVDVERLLDFGQQNRSVAATHSNERSSRSHAIFIIKLAQIESVAQRRGPAQNLRTESRLHIVDLAGSEKTSKVSSTVKRSKESRNINTSLMTLSRCLEGLRAKSRKRQAGVVDKRIVPFRDSRLTRLLQHPLSSGAAVMIATAAPTLEDADETIHTLRCSAVAREVKTNVKLQRRPLVDLSNAKTLESGVPAGTTTAAAGARKPVGRLLRARGGIPIQAPRAVAIERDPGVLKAHLELAKEHEELVETHTKTVKELIESKKEIAELREMEKKYLKELETSENAYNATQEELDELFRENDRVRDLLAEAVIRVKKTEIDIRDNAVREMEAITKEMEERYESQIVDLYKRLNESDERTTRTMTQTERRQTAERLARRLTRQSCAALETTRNILRESTGQGSEGTYEEENEYVQEDENEYEEEDEE